jgi:hypothetical protein
VIMTGCGVLRELDLAALGIGPLASAQPRLDQQARRRTIADLSSSSTEFKQVAGGSGLARRPDTANSPGLWSVSA